MLEISKTSKTIVVIVITFIITVYFNVLVVQTGYDNEIPIYHHDKISDFLQSVLFCFGAIPFIVFVIIYYLYTLFFELCNSKERIFLISIILALGMGMYWQYISDYKETHRWELVYKTSLTLQEINWIDGIERSCKRANKGGSLECKTSLIPDKELHEHWDYENAKAEAAAERDADLPNCYRC